MTHIDDWIDTVVGRDRITEGEIHARLFFEFARMPAWKQSLYRGHMSNLRLFCTYEGNRYRVTGASRMGDIWLAKDFARIDGYDLRVDVDACSNWSPSP